ncbi:MAG: TraR/DksA C4-type zinc finger protein [Dehalococcoidia bacterium]|nr:TraR/DksA C4-type zinc finger protein [Dehalococcoidia bacterium]
MEYTSARGPRSGIGELVEAGALVKLMKKAGEIHGHFCPFLAVGVKAGWRAVTELRVNSAGMEDVVAIVETNSCFSDGIQVVTGCTFGNNSLIYRDYGKTAVTVARRNGKGVRVSVKLKGEFLNEREPETMRLFQAVVAERKGSESDRTRLMEEWKRVGFDMLDIPDAELFEVRKVKADIPSYARIFTSVKCSVCGEDVMEPRVRMKSGKPVCIPCSGREYYQLSGDGMCLRRDNG